MITKIHPLFIRNTFVSNTRLKLAKKNNWAKAKQNAEAELLLLKYYVVSSSTLSSKDNRRYSKKCAKNIYVFLNEDIWLIAKKMRLKMKNRSSRYDKNRPRCWHGHKYTKYKRSLDMIIVTSIRQHLRYIWSLTWLVWLIWNWFLQTNVFIIW